MKLDAVTTEIRSRAHMRFAVEGSSEIRMRLKDLTTADGIECEVMRLRRLNTNSGWKTVLLIRTQNSDRMIHDAYRWAANVRDQLTEPETADLYLLMLVEDIADEDALRIETDEQFCRKIVLRRDEHAKQLLDRTFLANVSSQTSHQSVADPLTSAFTSATSEFPWLKDVEEEWRESLISGKTGTELANALVAAVPTRVNRL